MHSKVASAASAPDPIGPQLPVAAQPAPREPTAAKGPDPVEMRLVIEQDQATGAFVYKTVNRLTGEIVQQLPRAEVLKMREGGQYTAGAVIKTEA